MDFKNLDKETKQKLGLAVAVAFGLLYSAYTFGLVPLLQRVTQLDVDVSTLEGDVMTTQRAVRMERSSTEKFDMLKEELSVISESDLPPKDGPLSWVSGRLNAAARSAGVTLDTVSGVAQRGEAADRAFSAFGVRVRLSASYFDLINLLRSLEENNPYMAVVELSIQVDTKDAETQLLDLLIEWPLRNDLEKPEPEEEAS